jgi:ABC-type nitrate/sulfonate/bicarbonate transport system substrate-binding protein
MKRLIVALACLALVAGGCADDASDNAAEQRKVTLMLDWTPNTNHSGIYVAKHKGYYDKANLDVEILQPGEQGALAALGSGSVDFAVSVQESLIPARAQGVPVVSIAAILSTNTSSLVSLASDNITRPKDLEGKTYGGYGGELEQHLVKSLIQCDGGDPSKVKFIDVGNVDYRTGLEQNNYDFVWVFDGWDVLRLRQQSVALNTISFAANFGCIPDWYTPLLATTEKKISDDKDLVSAFTDATAQGYRDAIADPSAASDALLAGAPELDPTLVKESSKYLAKYYAKPGQPWGVQDKAVWTRFEEFLRTAKLTEKPVDVDKAFTNQFIPQS